MRFKHLGCASSIWDALQAFGMRFKHLGCASSIWDALQAFGRAGLDGFAEVFQPNKLVSTYPHSINSRIAFQTFFFKQFKLFEKKCLKP
jgi:hypothetical protein